MRLVRIAFNGFKRLENTACNVDGKLIAILGANEAGKSSVLEGLAWLTDAGERLPDYKRTRNVDISDDTEVVRVSFLLSKEELETLSDFEVEGLPREFVMARTAAGTRRWGAFPTPRWPSEPFERARDVLGEIVEFIGSTFVQNDKLTPIDDSISKARVVLEEPGSIDNSSPAILVAANSAFKGLKDNSGLVISSAMAHDPVFDQVDKLSAKLDKAIRPILTMIEMGKPENAIRHKLEKIAPEFVLFSEEDRILNTNYELSDESLRANPPRALANLLTSAGISLDEVYQAIAGGDTTKRKSMLRRANNRLAESLASYWQQRHLSLTIDTDGTTLQVLIDENDDSGTVTAIHERSDGLRAFVALLCFLAVQRSSRPQILLIDEAENHLHIDAQADLISMLSSQGLAQQVLYTTHSPACLPSDLGSCVRLVEPLKNRPGVSRLKNNFWQDSSYGFSPLLFAMGAGAAAFSVCRRAVLCEGPSEMILLPAMMRFANKLEQLDYQVAPGLSVVAKRELDASSVASRVVYLTDGDAGGGAIKGELRRSGVPEEDIFSFEENLALEDLLVDQVYVDVVNSLIEDAGVTDRRANLDSIKGPHTCSKNLEVWADFEGVRLPSKVAVASKLVFGHDEDMISGKGKEALIGLHKKITERLNSSNYQL